MVNVAAIGGIINPDMAIELEVGVGVTVGVTVGVYEFTGVAVIVGVGVGVGVHGPAPIASETPESLTGIGIGTVGATQGTR